MPKTTNYNLEKPNDNNIADIAVINNNMDIVDTELFNKVDKEAGKGLSSNDFTDVEKQKLAELSNFDSSAVDSHMQNVTKHITAVERASWNNKVDKVSGKGLSTNDFTNDFKEKLEGLQNYDSSNVDSHISNTKNPHSVTADQIGAATLADFSDLRMANNYEGVRIEYDWANGLVTQQRHYDADNRLLKQVDYTWNDAKVTQEVYVLNGYNDAGTLVGTNTVTVTYTWTGDVVTETGVVIS